MSREDYFARFNALAYEESLALSRRLSEQLGTPESARDVSVSLDNVGRVRVRGLELTVDYDAVAGINGLAIQANLAFNRSKILQNSFAASVGKQWPRLPKIRANLSASYALNPLAITAIVGKPAPTLARCAAMSMP